MQKHHKILFYWGLIGLILVFLGFSGQEVLAYDPPAGRGLGLAAGAPAPVQLFPVDGNAGDQFGKAVSIWGDTLVVGLPEANSSGLTNSGAVHVYTRTEGIWEKFATLTAPDPEAEAKFGASVAIYEETIVVGEPNKGSGGANNGAAYVFARQLDDSWDTGTALNPDEVIPATSEFGSSVAVYGETIVVGAPEYNAQRGTAIVFVSEAAGWTQQEKLIAPDEDEVGGGGFGCSAAVWEDWVIVGANTYKGYGDHFATGAAFGFQRVDGNWTDPGSLIIPAGVLEGANHYGKSVAIWETRVVVGAPAKEDGLDKAFIFELGETDWDWVATLDHENTLEFGSSVSLWDDRILVSDSNFGGELSVMDKEVDGVGAAFLFEPSGDSWALRDQFQVAGSVAYGAAVALHQDTFAVGDTEQASAGPASLTEKGSTGSVYVYDLSAGEIFFPIFFR